MTSVPDYHYSVTWSEPDQEWVGLCAEFPSLSWLEPSEEAAHDGIIWLVRESVLNMQQNGATPPAPRVL